MLCDGIYKHIVPTGLKIPCSTVIYKHSVPTGLKSIPNSQIIPKLTPLVTKTLRTLKSISILTKTQKSVKLQKNREGSIKHLNSKKWTNQEALNKALNIYRDTMRRFILTNLSTLERLPTKDRFQNEADIDIGKFPYLIRTYWDQAFEHHFDRYRDVRSAVGIITEARNKTSHPGTEDLTWEYASSRLYEIADILGQIKAPEQKREVEVIRDKREVEVICDKLLTRAASTDKDAYEFLKTLGVQEYDIVEKIIETILPKYKAIIEAPPEVIARIESYLQLPSDNSITYVPKSQDTPFPVGDEQNETSRGLRKFTNLKVTMHDKTVIHHYRSQDTYIEVLKMLDLEKVMRVRPNIVSREPFTGYKTKGIKVDEFWVRGTIGFCNDDRTGELEKIARLLDVPLIVERVERK